MPRNGKKVSETVPAAPTSTGRGGNSARILRAVVPKYQPVDLSPAPVKKRIMKLNVNGRKGKPSYVKMIVRAITEDGGHSRTGTSFQSIANFIAANYPVKENYKRYLKAALLSAVEAKLMTKLANSYRLTPKAKKTKARKSASKATARVGTASRPGPGRKSDVMMKKTGLAKTAKTKVRAAPQKKSGTVAARTARLAMDNGNMDSDDDTTGQTYNTELVWVWQFKENDGHFYNYDKNASDTVELAYQDYLVDPRQVDVRQVKSGQWSYMVDFRQNTQQNVKHEAHTTRDIRRYQVPANELHKRKPYD